MADQQAADLLRDRILSRIENGDPASYREVHNEESSHFPRAVRSLVPWKTIYPDMKAARLLFYAHLPQTSLSEVAVGLQVPLSSTIDGIDDMKSKFIASSDGSSLILCSARNAAVLSRMKLAFCMLQELTTSPQLQLLVLGGNLYDYTLPLVYCLLEKNNLTSYQSVLSHLREKAPHFTPEVVISPEDQILREAWNLEFPNIAHRLHHYAIQDLGPHVTKCHLLFSQDLFFIIGSCAELEDKVTKDIRLLREGVRPTYSRKLQFIDLQ